jgi:hypothetical protein
VEALEVKNHAPFRYDRSVGSLKVSDTGPYAEIAAWHVPQLALEMYCLGAECRGAVFVSQSATRGAVILRLRRDDDYIRAILAELRRFHTNFVLSGVLPPENFWTGLPEHRRILEATLEQAKSAQVVATLRNGLIQRSPWGSLETLFHETTDPPSNTHGNATTSVAVKGAGGRPQSGPAVRSSTSRQQAPRASSQPAAGGAEPARSSVMACRFIPSSVVPRTAKSG